MGSSIWLKATKLSTDKPSLKLACKCHGPFKVVTMDLITDLPESNGYNAIYSEQKNCPTKGQISLVRQIAAQITKVNPWEINITKLNILFFVMPNNKHLASFVDFIMTLRWDPFDGTIFLHTIKLALHIHIT